MLTIEPLTKDRYREWDDFVSCCPEATFFHRSGWLEVIETTQGHRARALLARRNGQTCGVLPLAEVKSRLFGHALVSTPFCVYGGVACDDEDARLALLEEAKGLAERLGVDYLELRHRRPLTPGWPSRSGHATFVRELVDEDGSMKAMKRKQRAVVRKAIANGHEIRFDQHIGDFYRIYSTSVRNLGTPVFSRRFFEALTRTFSEECEVVTVLHEGQPVSSLMSFYDRNTVLPYYGGGLPEARDLKSMDFMYWNQMQRALNRGIRYYDFGRSKVESGPYHYKRHWGFEPQPLCYEYHLVRARELPDLSPNNPRYQLMITLWKRLPLWLTQTIGPPIARSLG